MSAMFQSVAEWIAAPAETHPSLATPAPARDSGGEQPRIPGGIRMWPIRSALFVPAHRRDWVGKAIRVSPGAAVLDIEDSVPPEFKPQAMALLREEIAELREAGVGAFVRVNPLSDRTGEEIAAAMTEGLTAIVLPKATNPGEIRRLHDLL